MNIHDVSDAPQYVQMLQRQKSMLKDAQSRKGQRPPTRPPRQETIMKFTLGLMQQIALGSTTQNDFRVHSSFVPPAYPPCTKPLSELTKITIDELRLETHHRGRYLLVQAVTPQDRMTAIMAIVEDEKGNIVLLQLYHQESDFELVNPEGKRRGALLVPSMVMIIKEPYLKMTSDGGVGLRVDHLSDIEILSWLDNRVPKKWQDPIFPVNGPTTANDWKLKGDEVYDPDNNPNPAFAIELYDHALTCSPTAEEINTIRLARSLCYIKMCKFDAALADAESTIADGEKMKSSIERALLRKAAALYGLGRYRECNDTLVRLRTEYPKGGSKDSARGLLTRSLARHAEVKHGRYNFGEMHMDTEIVRPPHLDYATYIGPVQVRSSPGRGRGIFTTKAVKVGDLLFCEKAFAHAFYDDRADSTHKKNMAVLIDVGNDRITMGTQPELINMVLQKIYRNPSLARDVVGLHCGSYQSVTHAPTANRTGNNNDRSTGTASALPVVDNSPVIDTFLIQRIIALNVFGCPSISTRADHYTKEGRHRKQERDDRDRTTEQRFHSSGLWTFASHMNHSCVSNTRRAFIGDMMVVRATKDLPANTELTCWYSTVSSSETSRNEKLKQHWGFTCDCSLCVDERNNSNMSASLKQKRIGLRLQQIFDNFLDRDGGKITKKEAKELDKLAIEFEATYEGCAPASEAPRLSLFEMLGCLVQLYYAEENSDPVKGIKYILAALKALGFVIEGGDVSKTSGGSDKKEGKLVVKQWGMMLDDVLKYWFKLSQMYHLAGYLTLAGAALDYASITYKICAGEDETFREVYGVLF